MALRSSLMIAALTSVAGTAWFAAPAARGAATCDCSIGSVWKTYGICDCAEATSSHYTYLTHYTNDTQVTNCGDGDYMDGQRAYEIAQYLADADDFYNSFSFAIPYQENAAPDNPFDVMVYDFGNKTAVTSASYMKFTADHRGGCVDELYTQLRTLHELFHSVQFDYAGQIGDTDYLFSMGNWVAEGMAAAVEDRMYDLGDAATDRDSFYVEINPWWDDPETSLCDRSYSAALFWSYCCEQYGTQATEPENGIDFLRNFYQYATINSTYNSIDILETTIDGYGGESLDDTYHTFSICNYTKDLDLSVLPDPTPYFYIDENQFGEGSYGTVNRSVETTTTSIMTLNQPEYAARYYQAPTSGVPMCEAVGFKGTSSETMGWAAVSEDTMGALLTLLQTRDREFGATFIVDPVEYPIDKLTAIATTLNNASGYQISFGTGAVSLSITEPTMDWLAPVGPSNDPGRFLVRVGVEGPESLKPEGVGTRSVVGLTASQFEVEVGGLAADVLTADYMGGEYWLVVQAPAQTVDGEYDLLVRLCNDVESTSSGAVHYGAWIVNHVLVIDRSGSMSVPTTGTKLAAAQIAANLYTDAVADTDSIGLVSFSGDASECNDDSTLEWPLSTATSTQRQNVINAANAITAGGQTSIGDGLVRAQAVLSTAPLADEDRVILLSDGKENEGAYWNDPHPSGCIPSDPVRDQIMPTPTRISAIALGDEADEALMQQIATDTNGVMSYVDVPDGSKSAAKAGSGSSLPTQLADAFLDILAGSRRSDRILTQTGTAIGGMTSIPFQITEAGLSDASIVINVDDPSATAVMTLRDPSGAVVTGASASIHGTSTHKAYNFYSALTPGTWTAEITTTTPLEYLVGVLATNRHGAQLELGVYQTRTGGIGGTAGSSFEQGVPVRIVAMLTDFQGPILDATVDVTVEDADGIIACGLNALNDNGEHGDRFADDGCYAARFSDTFPAGGEGFDADNEQMPPPQAHLRGSYVVTVHATGTTNGGVPFERTDSVVFQISPGGDADGDGLPNTWEVYYGTDPDVADDTLDPDRDGLKHFFEARAGTHPFDPDTDDDGEQDGSEQAAGLCPLNPTDGRVSFPLDVGVVTPGGCLAPSYAFPKANTNLLRFPWSSEYQEMQILRAQGMPQNFQQVATVLPAQGVGGLYEDTNLTGGEHYFYRFRAIGPDGAASRLSKVVVGIPIPPPACPGDIDGDGDTDVFDFGTLATQFGQPILPGEGADLDGSGNVDVFDFAGFASDFGCTAP